MTWSSRCVRSTITFNLCATSGGQLSALEHQPGQSGDGMKRGSPDHGPDWRSNAPGPSIALIIHLLLQVDDVERFFPDAARQVAGEIFISFHDILNFIGHLIEMIGQMSHSSRRTMGMRST